MSPPQDELLQFVGEEPHSVSLPAAAMAPWRILVVDDDLHVQRATRFALSAAKILGRGLELIPATCSSEALAILRQESDIALVLLDVVMETESAGLDLVAEIRRIPRHRATRIVLRTGQPGYAPEYDTIARYDINDYRSKAELSQSRLLTTVIAAVRAYQQLRALEVHRSGLECIVQTSSVLMASDGLAAFCATALDPLAAMLGVPAVGLACCRIAGPESELKTLAVRGGFDAPCNQPLAPRGDGAVFNQIQDSLLQQRDLVGTVGVSVYLGLPRSLEVVLFVVTNQDTQPDLTLLEVLSSSFSACLLNLNLVERMHTQAFVDGLTTLPNRVSFMARIDHALDQGRCPTLVLLDIDDFAGVNDLMGHAYGDQLLLACSARLSQALGPDVELARVGSNAFGLLGAATALEPERLRRLLAEPLQVQGAPHHVSVTCGLAVLAPGTERGQEWVKNVNIALKHAKRYNRGLHAVYSPDLGQETRQRAQLLARLQTAFSQRQLFLAYQPQVDLRTGQVLGLEALLRWRTDSGEMVPPDQFIPVAEQSGLILPLGEWVLQEACECLQWLNSQGLAPQRMAVNVSMLQFQRPEFLGTVRRVLAATGLPGDRLELEITESVAMLGSGVVFAAFSELREQGISLAVDDFGTGYSSLSYLDRLPIDRLKIDRAFVRQLSDPQGPRIAELIVQLAAKLGALVIAEGIEDEPTLQALLSLGCLQGQGYHMARPMARQELQTWLQARQRSLNAQ
jgi:diguanylate cyclase (GGDEF)-like protein